MIWWIIYSRTLEEGMATHSSILAWRIHGQKSLTGSYPQGRKELDKWNNLAHTLMYVVVQSISGVNSFWPHELQQDRLFCSPLSPGVCSNSCPLSLQWYLTISSSIAPIVFAFNLSQHQGLFQWVVFLCKVVKVLELQLQQQSFQWIFRVNFL